MTHNVPVKEILGSLKEMINRRANLPPEFSNDIEEEDEVIELVHIANPNRNKSRLSGEALRSASAQIKTLTDTIDNNGFKKKNNNLSDKVLEDLITELVKPHLIEWLDANLPRIVERVVKQEIQQLIPHEHD